jgi:hypothetical protein
MIAAASQGHGLVRVGLGNGASDSAGGGVTGTIQNIVCSRCRFPTGSHRKAGERAGAWCWCVGKHCWHNLAASLPGLARGLGTYWGT